MPEELSLAVVGASLGNPRRKGKPRGNRQMEILLREPSDPISKARLRIEVTVDGHPRMWPAHTTDGERGVGSTLVPIDSAEWCFRMSRGRWKAYRTWLVP